MEISEAIRKHDLRRSAATDHYVGTLRQSWIALGCSLLSILPQGTKV